MAVVISSSMAVGRLNAGRLRPKKAGEIDAPAELEAVKPWQLGQTDTTTSDVGFDDGVRLGAATQDELKTRPARDIDAPNLISAEQAAQLAGARELDAINAASIAAPNTLTSIPDTLEPPFTLNHARILYDNKLSDASGNALILSPNTYERASGTSFTFTMPSNRAIDSIGVLGNLSGVDVTVQYSTSTGGSFVTVASETPSNDRPLLLLFDEVSARRVRVTLSSSRQITHVSAGIALQMQRPIFGGHNPITMSRQTEYQSRRSESGNFVSRNIVREGLTGQYEWNNLTDDWVREYFDPFILSARKLPFFIAWRPEDYPDEVAYAWTTGDISPSNIGTRNLMSVSMDVQAYGD